MMSSNVYSTVPNSNVFFQQQRQQQQRQRRHNQNACGILVDLEEPEVQALTPPNTPTHGILINTCPAQETPETEECDLITSDCWLDQQQQQRQPRAFILMSNNNNNNGAGGVGGGNGEESTSGGGSSVCPTPDLIMIDADDDDDYDQWCHRGDTPARACCLTRIGLKLILLLALLYSFICSLDLLSVGFRLLGARVIGNFFADDGLLQNPVVGLMIGVLVTVLVQSSSTSTSIAVTMVASKIIRVRQAIPIMMGANIGTSVTNTIVSLMQSANREEFGRAFAAATVHDMFNWLTVVILLPLEMTTHYLERLTTFLMNEGASNGLHLDKSADKQFLNRLTKPLTSKIIQIDSKLVEKMAYVNYNSSTIVENDGINQSTDSLLIKCCSNGNNSAKCQQQCSLFGWLGFSDTCTGLILVSLSILTLCLCLMMLVKVLNSMLSGHIAKLIKRTMNRSYAFPYSILADYGAILVGCILTILVQSSSIFTSALTPLAGIGVISIERMYPLTLGSNIGTTTTGILAALAADPDRIHDTMQIAMCHLFFNLTGIALFYPVPSMRWPIPLAKLLGRITARYRWFSILYLLAMFVVLPLLVFSLSTLGPMAMSVFGGTFLLAAILAIIINMIQINHAQWLPRWLRDWRFLPLWMRSLDPLDRLIIRISRQLGCAKCCNGIYNNNDDDDGHKNSLSLGHHNESHHSRLHIMGAMYKAGSETQPMVEQQPLHRQQQLEQQDDILRLPSSYHESSVNETIKKVICKLAKVSNHQNQSSYNHGQSYPFSRHRWSLFNSHTIHSGWQAHRYYAPCPFGARDYNNFNNNNNSPPPPTTIIIAADSSSNNPNNNNNNNNLDINSVQQQRNDEGSGGGDGDGQETVPLTLDEIIGQQHHHHQ